ncbi:MAG TPA: flagellar basal body-associated FliL family protein [Candidatus Sulfotelmatobacter sp.]|nr:flagellar basal body-associated FliL family protein [Candidatus Sulfotelmatobacter sp.]HWI56625.1 flagellar basal body-associated FliL family protein [Bacillota bacterium]
MAANRMDPTSKPEEPAAANAAAPAGSAGGGFKAWLPLLGSFLLMPLLAYVMTQFVLLPRLQKGLGITAAAVTAAPEGKAKSGKEAAEANRESVTMTKLLVNVAGTMGARYLLVSLTVVGSDPDFKAKIQAHDPQLRDLACGVLGTKTLADLEKPGARNAIRSELMSGFNNILGGALIQEIYLPEFAIQ